MKTKKWAVCLNVSLQPCTWGKVKSKNEFCTVVEYAEDASSFCGDPIETWKTEYIKFVNSEEEARNIVKEYEKTIDYDPR